MTNVWLAALRLKMPTDQKQERRRDDERINRLVAFMDTYEDFLKLAMKDAQERSALRRSIIEKSLAGLVWATIVMIGYAAWDYIKAHLK